MDEQLRNDTVMKYMPLVHKVVHKLKINSSEYDHDDLVNIGVIGLMNAIEKYDASLNVPFVNYAYVRIKGSIIDEVRKTQPVPHRKMKAVTDYYNASRTLQQTLLREPTEVDICQFLGLSERDLKKIYETVNHLSQQSLDDILFDNHDTPSTVMDVTPDTSAVIASDVVIEKEQNSRLKRAISTLTDREQQILQLIYFEELNMKEVSYVCDVSAARVSQIHGKALLKLREEIRKDECE